MHLLSRLLLAAALLIGCCAVLLYGFLTSMACGYAPNSSGCRGELNGDDQFWLVILPALVVGTLLVFARLARNKAR
ncbi:hypothetical protein MZO42_20040 [Sphingomonas psychrotolerans]|uniref:Uncharacterized protein n=1 Tax=Sphingomonas psychrotolerans TaxID=1327635 RepID=A0ABU3NBY1_9SPHN|nr:hypothetical protein [Sphingomonas psychrotolerans]